LRPVPDWLNWLLAIITLVGTGVVVVTKTRAFLAYLRQPSSPGSRRSRSKRDYWFGAALATLCALLWSVSYVSISDVTRAGTSLLTINVVLMGSATIFLYVGALLTRWWEQRAGSAAEASVPWRAGHAQLLVVANLGNFVLSALALRYISASQANTLNNMSPVLLAVALLVSGRLALTLSTAVTVALVALGVWLANADPNFHVRTGADLTGSMIALIAGASFALWAYLMDRVEDRVPRASTRMRLLALVFFASYTLLVTAAWLREDAAPIGRYALNVLALNGVRVAIVYYLFQLAIRRAGPLLPSVVVVVQVPLTMLVDHVWLRTTIPPQLIIGATLIVLGIVALLSDELRRVGMREADAPRVDAEPAAAPTG
jgi:drug/metabolite transporter (DMT)-like permease